MTDAVVDAPVLFEEAVATGGKRLGIATLNAPASLNGLSLEMAKLLSAQLDVWENDPAIVAVILRGSGDKAFCAGGDLQSLYRSMLEQRAAGGDDILANAYAREFFAVEYRLNYRIHTFPKPILCWGHGYVMGGGIGLMAGASHRVVTEGSRLAMPEIGIGLYPDVGGSWLLGRVPGKTGRFLALTAAQLNTSDAIFAGLADYAVAHARYDELLQALGHQRWTDDRLCNDRLITELLRDFAFPLQSGPLRAHFDSISELCNRATLEEVVEAIGALQTDDAWLLKAKAALAAGSPGSARLAWELQRRVYHLSLIDTFRLEYLVSLHCVAHGDFAEGIRALLIDKDRTPHWRPATLADASREWAETFFIAPWAKAQHPLAALGADNDNGV